MFESQKVQLARLFRELTLRAYQAFFQGFVVFPPTNLLVFTAS